MELVASPAEDGGTVLRKDYALELVNLLGLSRFGEKACSDETPAKVCQSIPAARMFLEEFFGEDLPSDATFFRQVGRLAQIGKLGSRIDLLGFKATLRSKTSKKARWENRFKFLDSYTKFLGSEAADRLAYQWANDLFHDLQRLVTTTSQSRTIRLEMESSLKGYLSEEQKFLSNAGTWDLIAESALTGTYGDATSRTLRVCYLNWLARKHCSPESVEVLEAATNFNYTGDQLMEACMHDFGLRSLLTDPAEAPYFEWLTGGEDMQETAVLAMQDRLTELQADLPYAEAQLGRQFSL